MIVVSCEPMGAPRQTRADAWKRRPVVLRYRAYKDQIRTACGRPAVPERLAVSFYLVMPASWSKKKRARMEGEAHRSKPDVDNLAKGVMDALWPDGDAEIAELRARKFWGYTGEIVVETELAQHAEDYEPTTTKKKKP